MTTLDRLPMRDVLVHQLHWEEDQARAFLDVFFTPVESLATKEDVEAVRAQLIAVRNELRGEMHGIRDELRGEMHGIRDELRGEIKDASEQARQYTDQRLGEMERRLTQRIDALDKRLDERDQSLRAEMREMIRASELRIALLIIGGFGTVIGFLIERVI